MVEFKIGYVLAIDQVTTSSRAIDFDEKQADSGVGQKEFTQIFPQSGWVEHDPEEIWESVVWAVRTAIEKAGISAAEISAIGITNQRETTLIWDRATGKAIHNAIVWQDRRTASICAALKKAGKEKVFSRKTGLLLDPYFSGTKVRWLLDKVKGARKRANAGELAFGTIDSFLIWRLTGGKVHATDATNASRTLMFNIARNKWDDELLAALDVPASLLPAVKDCADDFGTTDPGLFGAAIPILGVAGDQQAATIGQACFEPGMLKSTYGTGCFALLNTGSEMVKSKNRLLTTIAYRLDGKTTYALECLFGLRRMGLDLHGYRRAVEAAMRPPRAGRPGAGGRIRQQCRARRAPHRDRCHPAELDPHAHGKGMHRAALRRRHRVRPHT
ncbi:MAG: hypothetical protein HY371_03135, partial [Devosia nanyangense]|nr:hypothetical protein [Devosia nanyangense]